MHHNERPNDHQKFKELAALALGNALTDSERMELKRHLELCAACRAISSEYSLLGAEGMPFLAADCGHISEAEAWNDRAARNQLFSEIRESEPSPIVLTEASHPRPTGIFFTGNAGARWAMAAAAACLLVAVGAGAYQLGNRRTAGRAPTSAVAFAPFTRSTLEELASEKTAAEDLLVIQTAQISRLQKQISSEQRDLAGLRATLRAAESHSSDLSTANSNGEAQLQQISEERDKLAAQLRDADKAYQLLQVEFTSLRAEHDRALLHTASLESKIEELSAATRDQDHRLKDDEQYLASDRDIRELMGARKLYIADVFDVDSGSRTRKAFGRVFYTQNKSLIFYAFDLDRQPGVKNASAFQVWGQRDSELGAKSHPMNLGILYMDSESNRRWVLRWDDPKQLAEIDAVFVTVEPHGGSQKPTGKPFLYALLRKEANHP
jgi:anti-sigma-K factor RskA